MRNSVKLGTVVVDSPKLDLESKLGKKKQKTRYEKGLFPVRDVRGSLFIDPVTRYHLEIIKLGKKRNGKTFFSSPPPPPPPENLPAGSRARRTG